MPNLESPASNHEIGICIAVNVCSSHKYNNSNMAKEAVEKVCFFFFVINNFYFLFFHKQHNIISKIKQNKTADTYSTSQGSIKREGEREGQQEHKREKVCFNTVVLKVSVEEFSGTCVLFVWSF